MKAEIRDGILTMEPESETEAYALECWHNAAMDAIEQPEDGPQLIGAYSVDIGSFPPVRRIAR